MADVHIVPEDGRWKVEHGGDDLLVFDTEEGAVHAGQQVAAVAGCDVVVLGGGPGSNGSREGRAARPG